MENSSLGRVVSVLVAPKKTFESISRKPTWVIPLVLLILIGAITAVLVTQKMDFGEVIQARVEERGASMSDEELDRVVSMMERFGWVFGLLGAVVMQPAGYLIIALLFFLAFKIAGEIDFPRAFSVTLYSLMPYLILSAITIVLLFGRESIDAQAMQTQGLLMSNLAFLASEDSSPAVVALLRSFDFFTLWVLVLMSIGFAVVARVKTGTSAAIVFGIWVLWVIGKVGWAVISSSFGG